MNRYNSLASVEDASAALNAHPSFEEFLASFAPLAAGHGMQELAGASLLHRHFTLSDEQVIVESPETWQDQPALVSRPRVEDAGPLQPSTWRLDGRGSFEPLEYSEDPAVLPGSQALNDDFLSDYYALVARLELQHLLGLTMLPRQHLPLSAGQQYQEDTLDGCSVVVVIPESAVPEDAIVTVWAAGEYMGCSVYNTCHQRNICRYANEEHRHILGHVTERSHHRS